MAQKPKVSPSSVAGAFIFTLLLTLGYWFWPQIEMLLPFGGQTVTIDMQPEIADVRSLAEDASYIVIAKIGKKTKNMTLDVQMSGQQFIVFSEVTLEVQEVLKGDPALTAEQTMVTYEMGGSLLLEQSGRMQKVNFTYTDAAKLEQGSVYMLFLGSDFTVLHEKYGALLQTDETYYRDTYENVHTYESIISYLKEEDKP